MEHEEAAARAGVVIRELREIGEFEQVYRLFDEIWHPEPANVPVTVELMAGFAHTGNYVAGAFAGDALVGASVGFLASGEALHSHVTGAVIGRGVGYALKLHQRAWCRERGLARITWTFDPLVRRNAHFNLVKLGARPEAYLTEFYGAMADAINEGDASDRLLAVWRVTGGQEEKACPEEAYTLVREADDGRPVIGDPGGRRVLLVGTPRDVEGLRRQDAGKAMAWRMAVRDALGGAMAAGARVAGFTERGEYVVVIN
ncbi:putative GNAT superfamily acetyltransferase [Nonomuraea thailandensis]|uniref:GNAT superfamily acetyltransferase n=1 Tax=Nonomuraea thailandensis TaxID=1188745 RepID=A0A9X2GAM8_9ACTN|nr:GNAT family N-acetyltransferase [Nonomuraea thailandensis]MCP2354185.1 putative GNAT superfamily acetyltransferase [Nonomuraea thailandensis]